MNDLEQRVIVEPSSQSQVTNYGDEPTSSSPTVRSSTAAVSGTAGDMPPVVVDLNDSVVGENAAVNLSSNSIDLSSINVIGLDQASAPPTASTAENVPETSPGDSAKRKSSSKKRKLDELGVGLEYISDSDSSGNQNAIAIGTNHSPPNESIIATSIDTSHAPIDSNHHPHLSPSNNTVAGVVAENGHFDISVDPTSSSLITGSGEHSKLSNGSTNDASIANPNNLNLEPSDRIEGKHAHF